MIKPREFPARAVLRQPAKQFFKAAAASTGLERPLDFLDGILRGLKCARSTVISAGSIVTQDQNVSIEIEKPDRKHGLAASMNNPRQLAREEKLRRATVSALSSRPASSEPCDLAAARELVGGDERFLRSMMSMLLEDAPRWLGEIRSAIDGQDASRLATAAHRLKSMLIPFAAATALERADHLESLGLSAVLAGAEEEYRLLEQEIARLLAALRQFLSKASTSGPS